MRRGREAEEGWRTARGGFFLPSVSQLSQRVGNEGGGWRPRHRKWITMIENISNMASATVMRTRNAAVFCEKEKGAAMVDLLTAVVFLCWVVAGVCGFAALVCVYLKKPLRPVLMVFSISVLISFVAMLFLPRL